MYIRRTQTRSNATGEHYFTYRLVRSERIADKVKQVTLLNLGRHFSVDQSLLACRVVRTYRRTDGGAGQFSRSGFAEICGFGGRTHC
jgi:hypothetical protein